MKLASYLVRGKESYGVVSDGGLVDLRSRLGEKFPTLKSLLAAGEVDQARAQLKSRKPDFPLEGGTFLPGFPPAEENFFVWLKYNSPPAKNRAPETAYPKKVDR